MSRLQLCLHHELILLLLDDTKGHFQGSMYQYAVAGALFSELLLQGLIKVSPDDQLVSVAISSPTGDALMDEVIGLIVESKKPYDLKHWVTTVGNLPDLCGRVANQLCDLGVLKFNETKVLWLFTQKRYPEIDNCYEDAVRARMGDVMFTADQKTDERTSVLIALAKASNALSANFAPVQLSKHDERITEIAEGKLLASGATVEAITAVQACMTAILVATTVATNAATIANN